MTADEFNERWKHRIPEGWSGLQFDIDPNLNDHLSEQMEIIEKINPDFEIHQIKLKFGRARVYLENVEGRETIDLLENFINLAVQILDSKKEDN